MSGETASPGADLAGRFCKSNTRSPMRGEVEEGDFKSPRFLIPIEPPVVERRTKSPVVSSLGLVDSLQKADWKVFVTIPWLLSLPKEIFQRVSVNRQGLRRNGAYLTCPI